jgi:hypothetical protein
VPVGIARSKIRCFSASRAGYSCGLAVLVVLFGCRGIQNAVAHSYTRTTNVHHVRTGKNIRHNAEKRRHEVASEAAKTAPAQAAENPLLAGLEREAARRRQDMTTGAAASANAGSAAGTDNGASADETAKLRIAAARHVLNASAAEATGAITPLPGTLEDHVPADLMLAYAAQSNQGTPPATPKPLAAAPAPLPQPAAGTTIAVKRSAYQAVSTIITSRAPSASGDTHFDNPWLDAILISPSVHRFLTVLTLGTEDFRTFGALVEKPASAVMMTFGADPNPGMTDDHFSGSAIAFVSTVTYQTPTHTASLQ